jgi:hypothetical protein
MGSEYIETDNGPLCPNTHVLPNQNALHSLATKIEDRVYQAADRLSDGEIVPEHEKLVAAAANYDDSYMRLYRMETSIRPGGRGWQYVKSHPRAYVVAWYFQCPVCGFVMPAQLIDPGSAH